MRESLSEEHVETAIKPVLMNELAFYTMFNLDDRIQRDIMRQIGSKVKLSDASFAQHKTAILQKLETCVAQLSSILDYKHKLRFREIAIRKELIYYIKKLIFYGAMHNLFNHSSRVLIDIVIYHLNKFKNENLAYNTEQIKNMIEIRNEEERVQVVKEFDKMTADMKKIELVKKKLGIGKWAVGGTKLIYAYDKDYYDLERQRRLDAGIVDFPGLGIDNIPNEQQTDDLGFPESNEADEQDGYDHTEANDDL